MEDEGDDDTHKLRKLAHAATRGQPITVEISGDHPWGSGFARQYSGPPAPDHILEPLQTAYKVIEVLSNYYQGTGLPQSCRWTSAGLPREEIEVKVAKSGRGLHLSYGFRNSSDTALVNFPSRFRVNLVNDWSIFFGTSETPSDCQLTTRLV
jgi:hypothetical protein